MRHAEKNPEIRPVELPLFAEAGVPSNEVALPEVEKVPEVQPSLNHAAMHTKVSRHDGSNDAAIGQRDIAAQSQGEQAFARRSDGKHSHAAAATVENLGRTRDAILAILRKYPHGLTDEEIATIYQLDSIGNPEIPKRTESGLRSRRAELVKMGFVREVGTGKTAAGRPCGVWGIATNSIEDLRRTR